MAKKKVLKKDTKVKLYIKEWRQIRGLTQQELANRMGLERVSIFNLEHARYLPKEDTLAKLLAVLEVEEEELQANPYRCFWK